MKQKSTRLRFTGQFTADSFSEERYLTLLNVIRKKVEPSRELVKVKTVCSSTGASNRDEDLN